MDSSHAGVYSGRCEGEEVAAPSEEAASAVDEVPVLEAIEVVEEGGEKSPFDALFAEHLNREVERPGYIPEFIPERGSRQEGRPARVEIKKSNLAAELLREAADIVRSAGAQDFLETYRLSDAQLKQVAAFFSALEKEPRALEKLPAEAREPFLALLILLGWSFYSTQAIEERVGDQKEQLNEGRSASLVQDEIVGIFTSLRRAIKALSAADRAQAKNILGEAELLVRRAVGAGIFEGVVQHNISQAFYTIPTFVPRNELQFQRLLQVSTPEFAEERREDENGVRILPGDFTAGRDRVRALFVQNPPIPTGKQDAQGRPLTEPFRFLVYRTEFYYAERRDGSKALDPDSALCFELVAGRLEALLQDSKWDRAELKEVLCLLTNFRFLEAWKTEKKGQGTSLETLYRLFAERILASGFEKVAAGRLFSSKRDRELALLKEVFSAVDREGTEAIWPLMAAPDLAAFEQVKASQVFSDSAFNDLALLAAGRMSGIDRAEAAKRFIGGRSESWETAWALHQEHCGVQIVGRAILADAKERAVHQVLREWNGDAAGEYAPSGQTQDLLNRAMFLEGRASYVYCRDGLEFVQLAGGSGLSGWDGSELPFNLDDYTPVNAGDLDNLMALALKGHFSSYEEVHPFEAAALRRVKALLLARDPASPGVGPEIFPAVLDHYAAGRESRTSVLDLDLDRVRLQASDLDGVFSLLLSERMMKEIGVISGYLQSEPETYEGDADAQAAARKYRREKGGQSVAYQQLLQLFFRTALRDRPDEAETYRELLGQEFSRVVYATRESWDKDEALAQSVSDFNTLLDKQWSAAQTPR